MSTTGAPEPRFLAEPPGPRAAPPRPSCERVVQRARVLTLVVLRGTSEHQLGLGTPAIEKLNQKLRAEVTRLGLSDEVDAEERAWLAAPAGTLSHDAANRATWCTEGVVYLAWALGLTPGLARHDRMAELPATQELGLFTREVPPLASFRLRSESELGVMERRQLAITWRLRDYRVRPRAMDFAAFSRRAWFGAFDVAGIPLVDGDLAVDGVSISDVPDHIRTVAEGIALERRRASLWLAGHKPCYAACEPWT